MFNCSDVSGRSTHRPTPKPYRPGAPSVQPAAPLRLLQQHLTAQPGLPAPRHQCSSQETARRCCCCCSCCCAGKLPEGSCVEDADEGEAAAGGAAVGADVLQGGAEKHKQCSSMR